MDHAVPHAPPDAEPDRPHPPRRWWLKRLTSGCVLLAVALAGLRAWWGHEADRRLRRTLDAIAADGHPVRAADLTAPPIPDELNAAIYLDRAAAAVVPGADSPSSSALGYNAYPPYPPAWHALSDGSVKANGMAYVLARRARAHEQSDWRTPMPTPTIAVQLPHLNRTRHLANIVSDAALRAHLHGDDATALETVRDVRHQARVVSREHFLVSYLVGIGVENIALYKLQIIATGLKIGPDDETAPPPPGSPGAMSLLPATQPAAAPRPASRAQVQQLIAELLDDEHWREAMKRSLADERANTIDTGLWFGRQSRLLRPAFELDVVRLADDYRPYLRAAEQSTWPAAAQVITAAGKVTARPPAKHYLFGVGPAAPANARRPVINYARLLSDSDLQGSGGRVIMQDMRTRQQRRMTAVSLAAQLYRADHGGAWPASLQDLVPKYLPSVPADPFSPQGAPLRYLLARGALPGGGDRPVVYSVGDNGRDDTPDASALPPAPHFGWYRWRDNYLDLARWAPPAPPATMPATVPSAP